MGLGFVFIVTGIINDGLVARRLQKDA